MCYASCCHAFELLTLVLVHLPLLPFQSLWTWMGDDFCTVILFVNADTLYLVWLPSRSEVPWCGHRCALPISWSHKWELCICARPVFLSTYISKMCGLTGLQRCYSSQYNIHHTPFMCLSTWIDTLILCTQVYTHTASRLCFFFSLSPAHVTLYLSSLAFCCRYKLRSCCRSGGIIWDSVQNIITSFLQENWLLCNRC